MSKGGLRERLGVGQALVSDGATGTTLQARGLIPGTAPEQWVLEKPEAIIGLHRDFIEAGADIILTCTFGGTALRLRDAGLADQVVEVNQRAVALARQAAADSNTLVAGSLGPVGQLLQPWGPLAETEAVAAYATQAAALAEAGADLLVVETQFDLAEAMAAVKGVRAVTALPLVCSFSYDRGTHTMMGVKPAQMAEALLGLDVDVLGINCGRSLDENLRALQELRQATELPIWFKPNAGLPHLDEEARPVYDVSPEGMGALAPAWLAAGAQIIGGCCGTSPEHLQQIARALGRGERATGELSVPGE